MSLSDLIDRLGTQEEAAATIGVAQSTISSWVNGKATPRGLALRALAGALGRSEAEVAAVIAADRAALVAPAADASSMVQVPCPDHSAPVSA